MTHLFQQFNARQTWHETDDPDIVLAVILEGMLHLLNVAFDFVSAFKSNRHGQSSMEKEL